MPACSYHPPPGHIGPRLPEETAYGASRSGEAGFCGDFAVGQHVTRFEPGNDLEGGILEFGHSVPNRRSPMSPSPGAM